MRWLDALARLVARAMVAHAGAAGHGRRWMLVTFEDGRPLLARLRLIDGRRFGVYLHALVASDLPEPHDHPWGFASLVLAGGYVEHRMDPRTGERWSEARRPLSMAPREAGDTHVIELGELPGGDEQPAITLFFRGRRSREWGFWTKAAAGEGGGFLRWVPWREWKRSP